jgi:OmpA-OmpF porin, OOP family
MFAYSPRPERRGDRDGDGFEDALDACPELAGVASEDPLQHGCPAPSDRDGDGIYDASDACPDEVGAASDDPAKHGCPPAPSDRDDDGVVDASDACPDEKGVASLDPTKNGCPPDRDGDGVIDDRDACPDLAGIASEDPATNGCPGDRDGDGVRDDADACPDEKGVADADPTKNGCPRAVRVTETEVVILQQVQFDTAKSSVRRESDALLDEVAQVLKEHPEITRMEVQGHTDDRGGKQLNATLSKARAKSVMDALVRRGIEGSRLSSQGYGQDKPVADNTTPEGRQKNRRVQFIILEKKPKVQR